MHQTGDIAGLNRVRVIEAARDIARAKFRLTREFMQVPTEDLDFAAESLAVKRLNPTSEIRDVTGRSPSRE
jgi:hypothetical protein